MALSTQTANRSLTVALPTFVVAGCLIALLSFGPRTIMGLFLAPMTEARGWSREAFALSIAIQNIMWGIGQPFAGAVADRYGSGRVLAVGGLIYAAGLVLMAWAPNPLWLDLSAGVMVGLGMAAASFSIVLAAFGRRVPAARQPLMFGIGTAAGSLGQFVFAPLGQGLISTYGWAQALLVLAAVMLAIPFLAVALAGSPTATDIAVREQSLRQALAEAFGHRSFNLLVAGFFVCGFQLAFVTTHLPPYLIDRGLDVRLAAWALALIGLFNVAGSLASGWLGQTFSKPIVLAVIYLARAAIIIFLITTPPSAVTVLIFAAGMGLLWLATVPLTMGLVAVMFGPRFLATLSGMVFLSHQVGAFLGVWLGGYLYDRTGSYDIVWWIAVGLAVFAAIVHWPIRDAPAYQTASA